MAKPPADEKTDRRHRLKKALRYARRIMGGERRRQQRKPEDK